MIIPYDNRPVSFENVVEWINCFNKPNAIILSILGKRILWRQVQKNRFNHCFNLTHFRKLN